MPQFDILVADFDDEVIGVCAGLWNFPLANP
jgi:hypothetical protein